MKRGRQLAGSVLLLAAACSSAASAQPAAPVTAEAGAGRKLYVSTCQRCHGIELATNGIGFDLRTFPHDDRARFVRSVTYGLRAMPALGTALSPEQIELIWGYIGAVNGWQGMPRP